MLQCNGGTSSKVSNIIIRHIDNSKLLLICVLLLSHSLIFFRFLFYKIWLHFTYFYWKRLCSLIFVYVFLLLVYVFLSLSMCCLCILIVSLCILIVVYVFLLLVYVFFSLSMYSYCCLCIFRRGYPD